MNWLESMFYGPLLEAREAREFEHTSRSSSFGSAVLVGAMSKPKEVFDLGRLRDNVMEVLREAKGQTKTSGSPTQGVRAEESGPGAA